MEREPAEPAVAAVEVYKQEEAHRRRHWSLVVVALACTVLGASLVLAALRLAPNWFSPSPAKVVAVQDPERAIPPVAAATKLYSEPADPKVEEKPKEPEKPPEQPGAKPAAPGTGNLPLNPFSGAIISRSPVPEGWAPGSDTPSPKGSDRPQAPPTAQSAESTLVTIRSNSSNPEAEASDAAAALRAAGATVRTATHYNSAGSPIGVQIIATLPSKSLNSALSRLGSGDRWTGDPSDRAREVSGIFSARLRELRMREVELREKYEDDATEVVVVREEIQSLTQGLAMARSARSPAIAVVLVGIGDL